MVISRMGSCAIGMTAATNASQKFCPPDAPTTVPKPLVSQGSDIPNASQLDVSVGELLPSKKKPYPSKLVIGGLPYATRQWVECLESLKLTQLDPEKMKRIIHMFPTEESLRTALRNDAKTAETLMKSLKTTGGRTVGTQVAMQLYHSFGQLRGTIASAVARMPQANNTQDVAMVTPPESFIRSRDVGKAQLSHGTLKDDAFLRQ